MAEREKYLTEQIITYLGNKRSLLNFINGSIDIVMKELKKGKIDTFDVFSGSGVVSRFLKQFSNDLYVNDMEDYCYTINKCYLINENEFSHDELDYWFNYVNNLLCTQQLKTDGFIAKMYAPKDDKNIRLGERVFFTTRNAQYIDSARQYIDSVPEPYKTMLLGPLLYEASTKNNTSGVFKGFYKNSKTHISCNNCNVHIYQGDSNKICEMIPHVDLAYLDPPYNQHPYGSNYFMLNLINNYKEPKVVSKVSGIPTDWNKSNYNKKQEALCSFKNLCRKINAEYLLISYNSEGFISFEEMIGMLEEFGEVRTFDKKYNTFRGSRNLRERDIHVKEYLFLLHKEDK